MGCCYCLLQNGGTISGGSSNSSSSGKVQAVNVIDLEKAKLEMRREMAHLRTNDIALMELVEELQTRVKEIQTRISEIHGWMASAYVSHNGTRYVNGNAYNTAMNKVFTPYDLYRRYLVGDYEHDPTNHGFQLDESIWKRENVLPTEFTPITYLPWPGGNTSDRDPTKDENDRIVDRINVKNMFMSLSSGSGGAEADFSEYQQILNDPSADADLKKTVEAMLKQLYVENVMGQVEGEMLDEADESATP